MLDFLLNREYLFNFRAEGSYRKTVGSRIKPSNIETRTQANQKREGTQRSNAMPKPNK